MGNVTMEARDINYRGGETKMSVEDALKSTSGEAAAIAALQEAVGNLQTTKANQITIAPFFSAETAYDPGDLVYYNGLTYRCVNAHEGEWDADDFAATTISGELATLKSGFTANPLIFHATSTTNTEYELSDNINNYLMAAIIMYWGANPIGHIVFPAITFASTSGITLKSYDDAITFTIGARTNSKITLKSSNASANFAVYGIVKKS